MKRLLIINNIPTPYRTFMFNKMWEKGQEYDVEVTVAFQAERLSYRSWSPDEAEMRFPHFVSTGIVPFRRRRPLEQFSYLTFNTDILREVASGRYDWVLMAPLLSVGSWATALVPSGRTQKLLWSESNIISARFLGGPVRRFKGLLQAPFSFLVCPGQRAVDYVCYLNPKLAHKPILWLPNIVDRSVFGSAVGERRVERNKIRESLNVEANQIMILGVGQMVERKGFSRLIQAAAEVDGRYRIVLLGEGPLRQEWQQRIDQLGLAGRVCLPGAADQPLLIRCLAAADWFIHCALQDPSPLVVVEAATAGLPLAISTQTGNAPEAVREDINGFTFDASDGPSLVDALGRILATTSRDRLLMGRESELLTEERFDPDTVVDRFFQGLQA